MINYFKELLKTLKSIDAHLAAIEKNTGRVAKCVQEDHHNYGDRTSLSTKHWNS